MTTPSGRTTGTREPSTTGDATPGTRSARARPSCLRSGAATGRPQRPFQILCLALVALGCAAATASAARTETTVAEAERLLQAGRAREARAAFELLDKAAAGQCGACVVGLAEACVALQDLGAARKAAERARKLVTGDRPLSVRAGDALGLALAGQAGLNRDKLRAVEQVFREVLALDPRDAGANYGLGLALLRQQRDDEGVAQMRALLALEPSPSWVRAAREMIATPRRARVEFAPDFEVATLDGERLSLTSLRGQAVVLDFWATWCGPCVKSLPELRELRRAWAAQRLTLISVSVDADEGSWKAFVAKNKMDWPQHRDVEHALTKRFGVQAFPTYVVIDPEGAIVERVVGLNAQRSVVARVRAALQPLLGPPWR